MNDVVFQSCSGVRERPADVLWCFIYLRIAGLNDAGVTTYASIQVVFIPVAAVVVHEKLYA